MSSTFYAGVLAASLFVPTAANASVAVAFGPASASTAGPEITFNRLMTPTTIAGDATITFSVAADLDYYGEYIDVTVDGYSLGRVFDGNPGNDSFNFAGDIGSYSLMTGSAIISEATMAGLIADGLLDLSFAFSDLVNCCGIVGTLSGKITFDEGISAVSAVPLPAALPMFMFALGGLGAVARRRRS